MPKESANSWVAPRLAGDEQAAMITSTRGKKMVKVKIFPAIAPFYRRRRERGSGRAPRVGDECRRWAGLANPVARAGVPCFG
jgi:membrane glycosyltransferase